ncbi:MAG: nitronate monooxygenase family protein, partial [Pseudomonadota bacterium]
EARYLEENGADAIIAQGFEAGGHRGFFLEPEDACIGTMALVPAVVDAVSVPVIAAGGIADSRGIRAAFALGASGVQIGTAFLNCVEAGIPDIHKRELLASDGSNTRTTRLFSGRPARGIVNRYMQEMRDEENDLPDFPIMNTLTGPLRKASAAKASPDFVSLWSGQSVGLNRETTTAELVQQLVRDAGLDKE